MQAREDSDPAVGRKVLARHPLRAHIHAVIRLATALARRHGVDPARAGMAALLHDWLKPRSSEQLRFILRRHRVRLDAATRRASVLWHGHAAAAAAPSALGVRDREVLEAVRWHTSGTRRPSRLLQVLMVADFCADGRGFHEAQVGRRIARRNLAGAARYVLASKIAWLRSRGQLAPVMTACLASLAPALSEKSESKGA